jgi:hypothetical protein
MGRNMHRTTLVSLAPIALAFATAACGGSASSGAAPPDAGAEGSVAADAGAGAETGGQPSGSAIPLYACNGGVEYTVGTTIGGQQFQLTFDTGSTSLGVAAKTCTDCTGATPLYTPGSTAVDQKQATSSQYGSGAWQAEVYSDYTSMGSTTPFPLKFGAISTQKDPQSGQESGFFQPGTTCNSKSGNVDGIVGFGPADAVAPGTTGFFEGLVAANKVQNIFSYELCDSGGSLWLGGFDSSVFTGAVQYTPLVQQTYQGVPLNSLYYLVDLESISVKGGQAIAVPGTGVTNSVLDSGTSAFILSQTTYSALTTAIAADPSFQSVFGGNSSSFFTVDPQTGGGNCAQGLTQTKAQLDATLPPLTLTFGTGPSAITLKAPATESYLIDVPSYGWCNIMSSVPAGALGPIASIVGQPILRNAVVIMDMANQRVGFAPHTACN